MTEKSEARDDAAAMALLTDMFRRRNQRIESAINAILRPWVVVDASNQRSLVVSTGNPDDPNVWSLPAIPAVASEAGDIVVSVNIAGVERIVFNLTRSALTA